MMIKKIIILHCLLSVGMNAIAYDPQNELVQKLLSGDYVNYVNGLESVEGILNATDCIDVISDPSFSTEVQQTFLQVLHLHILHDTKNRNNTVKRFLLKFNADLVKPSDTQSPPGYLDLYENSMMALSNFNDEQVIQYIKQEWDLNLWRKRLPTLTDSEINSKVRLCIIMTLGSLIKEKPELFDFLIAEYPKEENKNISDMIFLFAYLNKAEYLKNNPHILPSDKFEIVWLEDEEHAHRLTSAQLQRYIEQNHQIPQNIKDLFYIHGGEEVFFFIPKGNDIDNPYQYKAISDTQNKKTTFTFILVSPGKNKKFETNIKKLRAGATMQDLKTDFGDIGDDKVRLYTLY